jgi:hypothetical protein
MSVNNRRVSGNRRTGRGRGGARGNEVRVNFAQRQNANPRERQNGPVMGVNGIMHGQIRCFRCNNLGHYSDNCPSPEGRVQNQGQVGVNAIQNENKPGINAVQNGNKGEDAENENNVRDSNEGSLNRDWILLDTCSTNSCTNNRKMIRNIRPCDKNEILELETNGGQIVFDQIGQMIDLPVVAHFNPDSLATIIAVKDVFNLNGSRIMFDLDEERAITVYYKNRVMKFFESGNGIYHYKKNIVIKNKIK